MARALIVGCGCRGSELGARLAREGWQVRGTSRTDAGVERMAAAGIEGAIADPDLPGTVLDLVGDVALVAWLLGSVSGAPQLHGPRLERLLEKLVDTPVRGFAYEAAGAATEAELRGGSQIVERAAQTWRIPIALLREAPPGEIGEWDGWADRSAEAVAGLLR